jgi:hypothetical protein
LIEEKYVGATAFVVIKIERLKRPAHPTISRSSKQGLKDRILPGNKTRRTV